MCQMLQYEYVTYPSDLDSKPHLCLNLDVIEESDPITTVSVSESAFAAGGPKAEKNYGQCKQSFNDNPCKNFHTGG
jgi:hypothetical protein